MIGFKKYFRSWILSSHGNIPHSEQNTCAFPTQTFVFQYQLSSTENKHWVFLTPATNALGQSFLLWICVSSDALLMSRYRLPIFWRLVHICVFKVRKPS